MSKEVKRFIASLEGGFVEVVEARDYDALLAENERLRMQLVACGVVALANTPESAAEARVMHPDYMSASCQDVMRAVDSEMALLAERDRLATENERLARDAKNDAIAYKAVIERQEELRAEVEALRKDAERYRWLRNPDQDVSLVLDKVTGEIPVDKFGCGGYRTYEYRAGEELDTAIDTALQGEQK